MHLSATALQVGVTMLTNHNITMNKPSTWECKTLENCEGWKPSQSIHWSGLADNKFVAFYETNTCHTSTTTYITSDPGQSSGSLEFKSALPIRSIMVGTNTNYARRPSVITALCPDESTTFNALEESGSAPNNGYNGSTIEDGLSSNWQDALPNAAMK